MYNNLAFFKKKLEILKQEKCMHRAIFDLTKQVTGGLAWEMYFTVTMYYTIISKNLNNSPKQSYRQKKPQSGMVTSYLIPARNMRAVTTFVAVLKKV